MGLDVPSKTTLHSSLLAIDDVISADLHPKVTPKGHLFSIDELFAEVAKDHWQSLDVLLQRGASRGALAKVVQQSKQREAFSKATDAAKMAVEVCEADAGTDACKEAKAHVKIITATESRAAYSNNSKADTDGTW